MGARERKDLKRKKERKSNVRYASIQKENTSEENKSKKKIEIRIKFTMIDEMEKLKKKKKDVKICASTKINIVLPYVGLFQKKKKKKKKKVLCVDAHILTSFFFFFS